MPPPIAQVEPLTTARALRGPFDYERPEGVGVGSVLVVPFGRRDVVGVVTGLAEASEHDVVAPRRVLEAELPPDLVDLALWIAREYASTPARALSLLLPPKGTRPKTALYAAAARPVAEGERLTDAPARAARLAAAVHRRRHRGAAAAGGRAGSSSIAPRVVRRAPVHVPVGARRASGRR